MTQYDRSCAILELPAVLAMLEREAVSEAAKARARALAPSADEAEVKRRLAETTAATVHASAAVCDHVMRATPQLSDPTSRPSPMSAA